jgi:hypothetical protein
VPEHRFRLYLVPSLPASREVPDPPVEPAAPVGVTRPEAGELRLALANQKRSGAIDGAWWPWPRPLAAQLAQMVEAVGKARGADVGEVSDDGTLQRTLNLADGSRVVLLVVPSDFDPDQARWAMAQSIEPDNELGPYELLRLARAGAPKNP